MRLGNREKYYIYERDNKCCFFCKKQLKYHQITLDHYLPASRGGRDEIFNLVTCCKACNKEKGSFVPEDYKEIILGLFIKAVSDGFISGEDIRMDAAELKKQLLQVDRIEDIGHSFVFQSPNMRFYVRDGVVIKVVFLTNGSQMSKNDL
jgi:hypothetical protein